LLPLTLSSLRTAVVVLERLGWNVEVIVCDNNSTDRTAELARAGGAMVVFEPVNQIGRARNTGAAAATGDWLIFLDADSQVSPPLLEDVAGAIQSGRYLAGGATVRVDEDHPLGRLVLGLWNTLSRSFKLLAGSFIFCRTDVFRAVGGFSADLYAGEELELTQRLKLAARKSRKKLLILSQNPLLTSARKLHLYTSREHMGFLLRTVLTGGKQLRNREACFTWYDGRR